ncbi:thioredoxin-like protein [Pyrenochaeta sp. DS3sAY3a]|nr:thioredoxin-like protein [Pyrenochaeta sp. DS3sAY3a]
MANPKITLFVDIGSPFCYMAFHLLRNTPAFKRCDITYTPILLGELLKMCDNKPPLQIKNKSDWLKKEHFRWARLLHIPISPDLPSCFPVNTGPMQRALTSISILYPDVLPSAISLLYLNFWNHHIYPAAPEQLHTMMAALVGSDKRAEKIITTSNSDEVKGKLMQATSSAFEEGAFGLPWMIATSTDGHKESFWGIQSMGQVCDHLELPRLKYGSKRALL